MNGRLLIWIFSNFEHKWSPSECSERPLNLSSEVCRSSELFIVWKWMWFWYVHSIIYQKLAEDEKIIWTFEQSYPFDNRSQLLTDAIKTNVLVVPRRTLQTLFDFGAKEQNVNKGKWIAAKTTFFIRFFDQWLEFILKSINNSQKNIDFIWWDGVDLKQSFIIHTRCVSLVIQAILSALFIFLSSFASLSMLNIR